MTTSALTKNPIAFATMLIIPCIALLVNMPIVDTLLRHSFDDGTYSHAYLIPLIYVFLAYQLYKHGLLVFRERLAIVPLILLVGSGYAFFVSSHAQISLGYWLMHVALITSATLLLFRYHWQLLIAPLYLAFMYPVWGILTEGLQTFSALMVSTLMQLTSIPTFVENEFITIPDGTFEIADGCSGLRYLLTALAIGILYIFLNLRKFQSIWRFMLFALAGALLTNWIRIIIIILVGHFTEMKSELIEDHNMFGWYIFIPFMFLLFKYGDRLVRKFEAPLDATDPLPSQTSAPSMLLVVISLGIFTVSGTSFIAFGEESNEQIETRQANNVLAPVVYFSSQQTVEQNGAIQQHVYQFDGYNLDAKPTYYLNRVVPEPWQIVDKNQHAQWQVLTVAQLNQRYLVATRYQVGDVQVPNRHQFKWLRIKAAIFGQNKTTLFWRAMPCQTNCLAEQPQFKANLDQ